MIISKILVFYTKLVLTLENVYELIKIELTVFNCFYFAIMV